VGVEPGCNGPSCQGYFYSFLGGGSAQRPAISPGITPDPVEGLFNGHFELASEAGWKFQGGGGSLVGTNLITSDGVDTYLRLVSGGSRKHNRFWLDNSFESFQFWYRFEIDSWSNDVLILRLITADGSAAPQAIYVETPTGPPDIWQNSGLLAIPSQFKNKACLLEFDHNVVVLNDGPIHIANVQLVPDVAPSGPVIYVNGACGDNSWTGLNPDCVAPDGPKATIQAAINAADLGDEVVVAPGIYTETIDLGGRAITVRSSGGRDVTTIDGQDASTVITCESGEGPDTVLDGFTITRGHGTSGHGNSRGGGMFNSGSSPKVINCRFVDNFALNSGGAIYNFNGSNPNIINCVFESNAVEQDAAGGVYNHMSSSPTFIGCVFRYNDGPSAGAMHNESCSPTIIQCDFIENQAVHGGAVTCNQSSDPTFTNCSFVGNYASTDGGAIRARFSSDPSFENCLFEDNEAQDDGGAIWVENGSLELDGCAFLSNSAADDGGAIFAVVGSTVSIEDCTFTSNGALSSGGAVGINGSDATILNSSFDDNYASGTAGGAILNESGSDNTTIGNCSFSGNWTAVWGGAIFNGNGSGPIALSDSIFCESSPQHIYGPWSDNGGNCLADSCVDQNGNGSPTECDADIDGDGAVGVTDFLQLLASWGPCPDPCPPSCPGDLDGDCNVGVTDFLLILANWS
jgi:predicted outer membrane repeat protein